MGLNKEGVPDEGAPRDTLEVYAYFTSANAFFWPYILPQLCSRANL